MSINFKQAPLWRIRNQRRICVMFIIVGTSLVTTFLLLESSNGFNVRRGSIKSIKTGSSSWDDRARGRDVRPRSKLTEKAQLDLETYLGMNSISRGGEKRKINNTIQNDDDSNGDLNPNKGLFLSRLRQRQAKLIRMNYRALRHPSSKPMLPFEETQALRKNVVANVCTMLNENSFGPKPPIPMHLLVDDNHDVIFCQIRKVASITWRQIFDEAASKKGHHSIRRLNTYTEAERDYRLKHYTKIMFVREPILRAVSGWNDKFVEANDRDHLHYVMHYGCDIARRAHMNISHIKICQDTDEPDMDRELTGGELLSHLRDAQALKISFEEFAKYLINGPVTIKNDMHWETYHSRCQPCQIKYDYIGAYETMQSDAETILQRTGLAKHVFPFPASQSNSRDIALEVLGNMDHLILMRLSELYHLDYQLFGYNLGKLQEWVDDDEAVDTSMVNNNY